MDNYIEILKREFDAEDGSFLVKLRSDLEWDKEAFSRLASVMQACCEEHENVETLERWITEGFWYIPTFVRSWTTHENFPRVHSKEYYEKAYQRLDDLAYWFFMGESGYLEGKVFEPS